MTIQEIVARLRAIPGRRCDPAHCVDQKPYLNLSLASTSMLIIPFKHYKGIRP